MNITSSEARFSASWSLELQIEPGSVPDRPMPYSQLQPAPFYRPVRLRLTFATSFQGAGPGLADLPMTALSLSASNTSFLASARSVVKVSGITIFGPRLKKDGKPGQLIAAEKFYFGTSKNVPAWAQETADAALADLNGGWVAGHGQ